jgi:hypothetical protein
MYDNEFKLKITINFLFVLPAKRQPAKCFDAEDLHGMQ